MNELKYRFINFVLLALLGLGIYWAFTTIDNGITYDKNAVINTSENTETEEVVLFENTKPEEGTVTETPAPVETAKVLSDEEKTILTKLQNLIKDNISMKEGSQGTRVGTVQKFLNMYFDTNKTVDNQYGPGTLADVKKFQQAEGLNADGQAGPTTYQKMIEVLEG